MSISVELTVFFSLALVLRNCDLAAGLISTTILFPFNLF